MYSFKFVYNEEVRRAQVPLEQTACGLLSFQVAAQAAKSLFFIDGPIKFLWSDDEGDVVSCTTDNELTEAIRILSAEGKKVFKFEIAVLSCGSSRVPTKAPDSAPLQAAATHPIASPSPSLATSATTSHPVYNGTTCSGCKMSPIVGILFKCSKRENFMLCSACEAKCPQPFPMTKIYTPCGGENKTTTTLNPGTPGFVPGSGHMKPQPGHPQCKGRGAPLPTNFEAPVAQGWQVPNNIAPEPGNNSANGKGGKRGRGGRGWSMGMPWFQSFGFHGAPVHNVMRYGSEAAAENPHSYPNPRAHGLPASHDVNIDRSNAEAGGYGPCHGYYPPQDFESYGFGHDFGGYPHPHSGPVPPMNSGLPLATGVKPADERMNHGKKHGGKHGWFRGLTGSGNSSSNAPAATVTATPITPQKSLELDSSISPALTMKAESPRSPAVTGNDGGCKLSKQFERIAKLFSAPTKQSSSSPVVSVAEDDIDQQLLDECLKKSLVDCQKSQYTYLEEYAKTNADPSFFSSSPRDARDSAELTTEDIIKSLIECKKAETIMRMSSSSLKAPPGLEFMDSEIGWGEDPVDPSTWQPTPGATQGCAELANYVNKLAAAAAVASLTDPSNCVDGAHGLQTSDGTKTPCARVAAAMAAAQASGQSPCATVAVVMAAAAGKPPGVCTKLMARFVRDVTFPDGTHVPPKSVLQKTWRIRNDGSIPWPKSVSLVCSGGDLLTDANLSVDVPALSAGEETDVTVDIHAPVSTGRYVAYFRLKVKDGPLFGQRVWIGIIVSEDESEWFKAPSKVTCPGANKKSSACPLSQAQVSSTAATSAADKATDIAIAAAIAQDINEIDAREQIRAIWCKELSVLADMGFSCETGYSPCKLIGLLEQLVQVPVSRSGAARPEGLQRVVHALMAENKIPGSQ